MTAAPLPALSSRAAGELRDQIKRRVETTLRLELARPLSTNLQIDADWDLHARLALERAEESGFHGLAASIRQLAQVP